MHPGRELIAIVEAGAGDDGVSPQSSVIPQFQRAQRHRRCHADGEDLLRLLRHIHIHTETSAPAALCEFRQIRMPQDRLRRHQVHVHGAVLVAADETACLVETHAELATMQGGFIDEFAILPLIAVRPVRAVQPVVHAPAQAVCRVLRVSTDAHGAHLRALVTAQIAICIRAEPQLRRLLQKDAAFHQRKASRHHQFVEEDRALVSRAVTVRVLQHHNAADWIALARAGHITHVALILHHPDAPLGIELKEDRALHHRLTSHQLRAVTRSQLEGLGFLRSGEHRGRWYFDALQEFFSLLPVRPSSQS